MLKINSIEEYIVRNEKWSDLLILMHEIIVSTGLSEGIKWNSPVYTLNGKNVICLGAFKHHFKIWFFQGVFLSDKHKLFVNMQEGKEKALRQMRFKSDGEVDENIIHDYVLEAIANQVAGKVFKPEENKIIIPVELKEAFMQDSAIEKCFKKFTHGKQYEFTYHVSKAKRAETRQRRVDKIIPLILQGIGLNEKYRH